MLITRVTDAEAEPISLNDIKSHLRIDETADHDVLELLITGVRQAVEQHIERTLLTTTWKVELDEFPGNVWRDGVWLANTAEPIMLPMQPIQTITSVKYYDSDNVQQTLSSANYEFDSSWRLQPVSTAVWPTTYRRINAVEIIYTAGYTDAGQIPENLLLAIKLMIGHYEQNREDTAFSPVTSIPDGFKFLLNQFRIHRV